MALGLDRSVVTSPIGSATGGSGRPVRAGTLFWQSKIHVETLFGPQYCHTKLYGSVPGLCIHRSVVASPIGSENSLIW